MVVSGQLQPANLRKARLTIEEFLTLLRLGGCLKLSEAWSAVLEPKGKLSIPAAIYAAIWEGSEPIYWAPKTGFAPPTWAPTMH